MGISFGLFALPEEGRSEYLLLANRDPRRAARLRAALRPEVQGIAEISRRDGREGRMELPDDIAENEFEVQLAPGDGRLFALVKREREGWPAPRRGEGISVGGVSVGVGR